MQFAAVEIEWEYTYFERQTEGEFTLRVKALEKNDEKKMIFCEALEAKGEFLEGDKFHVHPTQIRA